MTKLDILIPCLNEPKSQEFLRRINSILDPQIARYHGQVGKIIDERGRHIPTGTKRNDMIAYSAADYFSFVDVDDLVSSDYVRRLMEGIELGVDVVTFQGKMLTNGAHKVDFIIQLGEKYEERGGKYYRWPNHLCCFKRELVEKIKFPPVWNGEDYQWSRKINDMNILKTEHHIPTQIYTYEYVTNKQANPRR
jgi:glycosyltransferase involved in cell wall biosynthesis